MAFCSISKELSMTAQTQVENLFLFEYMPELSGEAVKVYLYGLYLCQNAPKNYACKDMAETLKLTEREVVDCFSQLESAGLVELLSKEPVEVRYIPVTAAVRPKKFKAEKYTDFTRALQAMLPSRMVSVTEYRAYFTLMETRNLKPEALLMIIRYCADKKGEAITYRYIETVAGDFADRGLLTADAVENELSDYFGKSDAIDAVLKKLGMKRKAEFADLKFYEKWTVDLGFPPEGVLLAAGKLKRGDLKKLDGLIGDLYAAKAFGKREIDEYFKKRDDLEALARELCRSLSVYVEVIDPVVSTYCARWSSYGYDREALLFLARYCFKRGRRSLEAMDELVQKLYQKGIVAIAAIYSHMEENRLAEKTVQEVLTAAGVERKVTDWDRETYAVWKDKWNFSEEMILYAARLAAGKSGPLAYMNAVLSAWKAESCYTLEQAERRQSMVLGKNKPSSQPFLQHSYTAEELDAMFADDDGGELL